eukprot:13369956-Alexandrium_andersonii.AAC.1
MVGAALRALPEKVDDVRLGVPSASLRSDPGAGDVDAALGDGDQRASARRGDVLAVCAFGGEGA